MSRFRIISSSEQVANHLRDELQRGIWTEEMPGAPTLATALGINPKTVISALELLERDGCIQSQGPGRRRKVVGQGGGRSARSLRIALLRHDNIDAGVHYMVDLKHQLLEAGHAASFASKSLMGLGMEVGRVARFVEKVDADAWIVMAASREVLHWFAEREQPAFALFGRHTRVPMPAVSPEKTEAYLVAVNRLVELGHRRIVHLLRPPHRLPEPSGVGRTFLSALQQHGIPTGPYNLPDWEDTPEGLQKGLDSLFAATPPTAVFADEPAIFFALQQYLATKGIRTPKEVSLVCADPDAYFKWSTPSVAHISWNSDQFVQRVMRWAANASRGKADCRKTFTRASYVDGGTVGPVFRGNR